MVIVVHLPCFVCPSTTNRFSFLFPPLGNVLGLHYILKSESPCPSGSLWAPEGWHPSVGFFAEMPVKVSRWQTEWGVCVGTEPWAASKGASSKGVPAHHFGEWLPWENVDPWCWVLWGMEGVKVPFSHEVPLKLNLVDGPPQVVTSAHNFQSSVTLVQVS